MNSEQPFTLDRYSEEILKPYANMLAKQAVADMLFCEGKQWGDLPKKRTWLSRLRAKFKEWKWRITTAKRVLLTGEVEDY